MDKPVCKTCAKPCELGYFTCDEEMADDAIWCETCFPLTPCGKGEHGEECPTTVFLGND